MKRIYKNLVTTAAGATLCLFLALPASAQRTNSGGSGGSSSNSGGSHPSGGGGGGGSTSSARPSGGGAPSGGRPAGVASYNRSSGSPGMVHTNGTAPVRGAVSYQRNPNYAYRPSANPINAARGNYGYAPQRPVISAPPRGYVGPQHGAGGVTAYRTSPRIGYGGYWGTHNYYHYNRGYYRTYYGARIGYTCTVLPYGYYPFYWGDYQYYYSDGLFYQYDDSQYTVVEPPVGAEVTTLPDNAQSIMINGVQYYEVNGVYYQPVTKDDGTVVYEVVGKDGELNTKDGSQLQQPQGPQMGDIVTQLPDDCRKIKVSGQKLWVSPDGIYFQELVDANGVTTYKIVGLPSDEADPNQQ